MELNASPIFLQAALVIYAGSMAAYLAFFFNQREGVQRLGRMLIGLGVLAHLFYTIDLGITLGGLPVQNLSQSLSIAALSFGSMFLYFQYRSNLKVLGVFASVLLTLTVLAAMVVPQSGPPPETALKGFWFHAHILMIFTGEAALVLACGAGILYLLQEKGIKAKTPGFFFKRLPSLDLLDTTIYVCLNTGFALMTAGLITGFIYARFVWGRFWSWDPKEVFSIGTWFVYATLLHFRFHSGWRGRKSAIMTIIGFLIIIFTFLGVNLFLGGHHQEFTK